MIDDPDYKDCRCHNCNELKKEYPDCACDEAGPYYCPAQCDECPFKNICDVPENPEYYISEYICVSCDTENRCAAFKKYRQEHLEAGRWPDLIPEVEE